MLNQIDTVTADVVGPSVHMLAGFPSANWKADHKYLFILYAKTEFTSNSDNLVISRSVVSTRNLIIGSSDWKICYCIVTARSGYATISANCSIGDKFYIRQDKFSIFDLTQMFGAGNEPSTVEEFKQLFPLKRRVSNS